MKTSSSRLSLDTLRSIEDSGDPAVQRQKFAQKAVGLRMTNGSTELET